MTVVGVTMVRDEADIIEPVVRHMLTQVDAVIVANNNSVDGTNDILYELQQTHSNLIVYFDDVVGYEQSKKMTALAHMAREEFRADWIVPFDADEIWYAPPGTTIGRFLEVRPNMHIVEANLYDHVATGLDNQLEPNPIARMHWRRGYAAPLPKVAVRYAKGLQIEMGNHGASYRNLTPRVSKDRLAIRHFPYRSPGQVIRKIRNGAEAYAATDLPEHFGAHWRSWGRILDERGEGAIADLFRKWHYRVQPSMSIDIDGDLSPPLRFDPACDVTPIC